MWTYRNVFAGRLFLRRPVQQRLVSSCGEVRLSPLGTSATNWPIIPAPDDRWWWVWSSRWNENWQGKPKDSKKTCPGATLPTRNQTWSDLSSNPGRHGENTAEVSERLSASFHITLRKLGQETGISHCSCRKSAKTIQLLPFKGHIFQQMLILRCEKRYYYCEWLPVKVEDKPHMLDASLLRWGVVPSDRLRELPEYFHTGDGKFPWKASNSQYPVKSGVWCASDSPQDWWARFLREHHWLWAILWHSPWSSRTPYWRESAEAWFQQGDTTRHKARATVHKIFLLFEVGTISKRLWPPRSPDFSTLNFFYRATLKTMPAAITHNQDEPKPNVSHITEWHLTHDAVGGARLFTHHAGAHFQTLL
jgi:hypothetical protein